MLGQPGEVVDVFRAGAAEDADIAADAGLRQIAHGLKGVARHQRRRGVGHGQHTGEPAGQRGRRAAGEVFLVLAAGHAQVGVDIHQTGKSQKCHVLSSEVLYRQRLAITCHELYEFLELVRSDS